MRLELPRMHLLGIGTLYAPDGIRHALKYRKGWALLGYLAVERGRFHGRELLSTLLWPALDMQAARNNLRQVLADLQCKLREAGFDSLLVTEKEAIGIFPVPRSRLLFDIDLIDPLLLTEDQAIGLLEPHSWPGNGCLLEGLKLQECREFEDWLQYTRQYLLRREQQLMELLRDHYCAHGLHDRAADLALRLITADRWNEAHHRALMRVLATAGNLNQALGAFESLRKTLRQDLDIEPGEASCALRDEIRAARDQSQ